MAVITDIHRSDDELRRVFSLHTNLLCDTRRLLSVLLHIIIITTFTSFLQAENLVKGFFLLYIITKIGTLTQDIKKQKQNNLYRCF